MMIIQTKDRYASPRCEVHWMQPEGVIAASGKGSGESSASWGSETWTEG